MESYGSLSCLQGSANGPIRYIALLHISLKSILILWELIFLQSGYEDCRLLGRNACSLIDVYWCFGETHCLHLHGKMDFLPKRQVFVRLHVREDSNFICILSSNLHQDIRSNLFPSDFPDTVQHAFLSSAVRDTSPSISCFSTRWPQ